jgi:hypothetical protein
VDEITSATRDGREPRPVTGLLLVPREFKVVVLCPVRVGSQVRLRVNLYPAMTETQGSFTRRLIEVLVMCILRAGEVDPIGTPPPEEQRMRAPTQPNTEERLRQASRSGDELRDNWDASGSAGTGCTSFTPSEAEECGPASAEANDTSATRSTSTERSDVHVSCESLRSSPCCAGAEELVSVPDIVLDSGGRRIWKLRTCELDVEIEDET